MELRKFTKLYASKYFLLVVLVLGVVILSLPNLLRDNPFMIGEESFSHLRIAKDILDGKEYGFFENALGHSIAGFSFITKLSVEDSAKTLLLLLGLGSLFLIFLILKFFEVKDGMLTLPILVFSPAFIYLFSVVNMFAAPFFLTLLLIYLFLKKRYILSGLIFLLIPFFNFSWAVFIIFTFVLISLFKKKKKLFGIVYLLLIFGWIYSLEGFNFELISDFGSHIGVSIFGVFIALFGLGLFLNKRKLVQLYFMVFLLFLVSLKFFWVVFILIIPFSLLIALNLAKISKMDWESGLIKELTVLLLICGLLFSGISSIKALSEEEPTRELFNALSILPRDSIVLSHNSNNYWIGYAGMGSVSEDVEVEKLFGTRDFNLATDILNRNNIQYILITSKMRHGLVWSDEEEGLLFLLKYSEEFEKVYEEDVEVWEYSG